MPTVASNVAVTCNQHGHGKVLGIVRWGEGNLRRNGCTDEKMTAAVCILFAGVGGDARRIRQRRVSCLS